MFMKRYTTFEEKEFIHWKAYLEIYLIKQTKKGYDWAFNILKYYYVKLSYLKVCGLFVQVILIPEFG